MLLTTPLETNDLMLRSLDETHASGPYALWMRDSEVTKYLQIKFAPPDVGQLADFIRRNNASDNSLLLGLFPRHEPARHIGNIKLGPIDRRHAVAALGILIGATEYWGKGLATQAVAALVRHGFDVLGLERIEARFYAENLGSQRAFQRAGFVPEGRLISRLKLGDARSDEILMGQLRDTSSL